MDRMTLSLKRAEQALKSLQDVLQINDVTDIERDAAIQRFEYTFESLWKAAHHYLREQEGIDAASPKSVIRSCREVGLLDTAEAALALAMTDDRNLTSHTYDRDLAQEIYSRLHGHFAMMEKWLARMMESI